MTNLAKKPPILPRNAECRILELDGGRGGQGRIPSIRTDKFHLWSNRSLVPGAHLRLTLFDPEAYQILYLYARVIEATVSSVLLGGILRGWWRSRLNLPGHRIHEYRLRLVSWVSVPHAEPNTAELFLQPAMLDTLAVLEPPKQKFVWPPRAIHCRVAQSLMERLSAWKIVYEELVRRNCIYPNRHGIFVTKFHLGPEAVTYTASDGHTAAGAALCGFVDSPMGLPADEFFGDTVSGLRHPERRFGELSFFAGIPHRRAALERLFEFSIRHSVRVLKVTDLLVVGNPAAVKFYRKFGFELVESRASPDGSRESGLYLLNMRRLEKLKKRWSGQGAEESAFEAPKAMNARELYEICIVRSDLAEKLNYYDKGVLSEFYPHLSDWFENLNTILQYC